MVGMSDGPSSRPDRNKKGKVMPVAKPKPRWIPGGDIDGCRRSLAWWRKQPGFSADKAEQWVARIDRQPDEEARLMGQQLARAAEQARQSGSVNAWWSVMQGAATKLQTLAAGPFLGRGGHRKDLFKFGDIVAYSPTATVIIQSTSRAMITGHLRDYRSDADIRHDILKWITLPGREFVIDGWGRQEIPNKSGNGTHMRWCLDQRIITPADLEEKAF